MGDWIVFPQRSAGATTQLICFPHAGAGVGAFRSWLGLLSPEIELGVVRAPGREKRFGEAPFRELRPLLEALVPELTRALRQPFAFFGHSIGALVAFEAARQIRRQNGRVGPVALFVSGRRSPRTFDQVRRVLSGLPPSELRTVVAELGGTPAEILDSEEMFEIVSVALRADLALSESYDYQPDEPLATEIRALVGSAESHLTVGDAAGWADETTRGFRVIEFDGDHFGFMQNPASIVGVINEELRIIVSARDHQVA